jgi:hypothetical protein
MNRLKKTNGIITVAFRFSRQDDADIHLLFSKEIIVCVTLDDVTSRNSILIVSPNGRRCVVSHRSHHEREKQIVVDLPIVTV